MTQLGVARRGSVAVLTLDRPEHDNRVSCEMAYEIAVALETARRDPEIGACVLTGRGDVFCLGGDYQGAGPSVHGRMEFARAFSDVIRAMAGLGKPLVVAVNGDAHAGGFSMVVACDLAIMAEDATVGLPEAARGLFPFLALAAVKDDIPKKLLFDIVYTARLMTAAEACATHLVNEAVPRGRVLERAVELAALAASRNADITMLGRDLYYGARGLSLSEALEKSRFALGVALHAGDRTG